ncbi:hypothetical protein KSS87_017242 [Heliosperma pusillum]|nr:hypothetical protein KSS87_017242 [Heliosperma pusillum]
MLPTLNMRGDVILMDKLSHRFGKVEAGDVVFVKSPQNPSRVLTKRVLGLEGDVVSFDTRSGIFESLVVSFFCVLFYVLIPNENLEVHSFGQHVSFALAVTPMDVSLVMDGVTEYLKGMFGYKETTYMRQTIHGTLVQFLVVLSKAKHYVGYGHLQNLVCWDHDAWTVRSGS